MLQVSGLADCPGVLIDLGWLRGSKARGSTLLHVKTLRPGRRFLLRRKEMVEAARRVIRMEESNGTYLCAAGH